MAARSSSYTQRRGGVMTTIHGPAPASFRSTDTQPHKARRRELPTTAQALARAFADDPVFAHCFPDPERRGRAIPAFFDLVLEALWPYDEIFTIGNPGGVVGGAVWVPPGEPAVPHYAEKAFEARLAEIAGRDIKRIGQVAELLELNHPSDTCAYLWFVGVEPESQGGGRGSALMAPMLQRCDAAEMPAYLEATTIRNRELYERHGFTVITELRVPDGPSMWPMWREPGAR
jgi:GNAT superfamily N-acetyltransferase